MWRLLTNAWITTRRHPWVTLAVVFLVVLVATAAGIHLKANYHHRRALEYLHAEAYGPARAELNEYFRFSWWRTGETLTLAARLHRLLGEHREAEDYLSQANEVLGGPTEQTRLEAVLLRAETGSFSLVEPELWELVRSKHPESAQVLRTLARMYYQYWRFVPALGTFDQWIELAPHSAEALEGRAQTWEQLHNDNNAGKDFRQAVAVAPNRNGARMLLIQFLLRTYADPGEIRGHIQHLLRQEPDNPAYLVAAARCKVLEGQFDAARHLFDQALQAEPNYPDALMYRAELEYQDGRFADAEKWARQGVAVGAKGYKLHYLVAESMKRQKDPKKLSEAEAYHQAFQEKKDYADRLGKLLSENWEDKRNDPDFLTEIGDILMRDGQERAALMWFEKALHRNPYHKRANTILAGYYQQKNDRELAARHLKMARAE
jgi:tetratricopeptide (TPR) repeat protein